MIPYYSLICLLYILAVAASEDQTPKPPRCFFMANPGPCGSSIKMYAYDPSIDTCMEFFYGGCGGNPNRFATEKECQTACGAEVFAEEKDISVPPGRRKFIIEFIKPEERHVDHAHTCAITNPI